MHLSEDVRRKNTWYIETCSITFQIPVGLLRDPVYLHIIHEEKATIEHVKSVKG